MHLTSKKGYFHMEMANGSVAVRRFYADFMQILDKCVAVRTVAQCTGVKTLMVILSVHSFL